ncbi:MAG: metal ABC transporter permease [Clostridia bacterium]|nr:metal ABC transporter permease [Clostridia bacterium]
MSEILSRIADYFAVASIPRAFILGLVVSVCASLLGVSLVLKRYSMIGDGLAHVGYGTLTVAYVLNTESIYISIPVVVAAAFFLLRLSENGKIKGDSAIAIVSSTSLALGTFITYITNNNTADVCNYLFGSMLNIKKDVAILSMILSVVVIVFFVLLYNRIFAVTFDETFAKATGTKAGLYNSAIALLTAITVVVGMKIMGAMLISSLIIFPSLTSMRFCKHFKAVVIYSAIISFICYIIGFFTALLTGTPTGAGIVLINAAIFIIVSLITAIYKRKGLKK